MEMVSAICGCGKMREFLRVSCRQIEIDDVVELAAGANPLIDGLPVRFESGIGIE